ncbi:hypothetical protein DRO03_06615 [Methanosarcinales archaeon]|nr:MAG: hypothetical protein DRO03_06615 [Methanosarcinales archaeon]
MPSGVAYLQDFSAVGSNVKTRCAGSVCKCGIWRLRETVMMGAESGVVGRFLRCGLEQVFMVIYQRNGD